MPGWTPKHLNVCKKEFVSYSLSAFPSSGSLMEIPGVIQGKVATFLIDTGATDNFVSSTLFPGHSLPAQLFKLANGTTFTCKGPVHLEFSVGSFQGKAAFLVADLAFDVVLGLKWLRSSGASLNLKEGSVSFPSLASLSPLQVVQVPQATTSSSPLALVDWPKEISPDLKAVLRQFTEVFPPSLPMVLPPDRGCEFHIDLRPGTRPVVRPMRRFSPPDMAALRKETDDLLASGLIKVSDSEFGAQVLFVDKKDGTRRMCVDYRSLNEATVKDAYPLPLIDEIFDRLKSAKYFSKLDLRSGYHQLKMKPEDTHKTAFRTPYGSFEFLVLPFGLSNAPGAFMRMMDKVFPPHQFRDFLGPFIDDLLIFSSSWEEHLIHVKLVLSRLQEAKLYAKLSKCMFGVTQVEYLGHIISGGGISSHPGKVSAVQEMPAPKNVAELRSFIGMVTYFHKFIKNFARLAVPLHALFKKGIKWTWSSDCQESFEALKRALSVAPILRPFDPTLPVIVQTDASMKAVGAVLLQESSTGLKPVAFYSRKLEDRETRYTVQELEMLAVISALEKWEHYLLGVPFKLESDHRSLEHVKTSKDPSKRVERWLSALSRFNFDIVYRPGPTNAVADSLSRLVPSLAAITSLSADPELLSKIKEGYRDDVYFGPVFQKWVLDESPSAKFAPRYSRCFARDGLLYFSDPLGDRLCIPALPEVKLLLLRESHDAVAAGHFGLEKTYQSLARRFFWPRLASSVKKFVSACQTCQAMKADTRPTAGVYRPVDVPDRPWESVGMDFITGLPTSVEGFDSILTVVDRFSKMAHFIPTVKTVTAPEVATLFVNQVFRFHGLPSSIVSDRDPKFTSEFWQALMTKLGTKLRMSTVDHPQSDGQAERANYSIIQLLKTFCSENAKSWSSLLPTLEFAHNNAPNKSSGVSPFFACTGAHPRVAQDFVAGPLATHQSMGVDLLARLKTISQKVRDSLTDAQDSQAEIANRGRREVVYKIGDKVWLDTALAAPSTVVADHKKLQPRFSGPYTVLAVQDNTVDLDLPLSLKTHPRVNLSRVRLHTPPLVELAEPDPEEDGSFEVESILRKRSIRGVMKYLVRWRGYDATHDTWQTAEDLENAQEVLDEFLAQE